MLQATLRARFINGWILFKLFKKYTVEHPRLPLWRHLAVNGAILRHMAVNGAIFFKFFFCQFYSEFYADFEYEVISVVICIF